MGARINSSVTVSRCVGYRLKICHCVFGQTQRSPSGKRTKGQVQLPSPIHFYVKLTLCQLQIYDLQCMQQGASLCCVCLA